MVKINRRMGGLAKYAKVIPDDGWKNIVSPIEHSWETGEEYGVEIEIKEA